jgi:hypothetical protein
MPATFTPPQKKKTDEMGGPQACSGNTSNIYIPNEEHQGPYFTERNITVLSSMLSFALYSTPCKQ